MERHLIARSVSPVSRPVCPPVSWPSLLPLAFVVLFVALTGAGPASAEERKVDLNRATVEQLDALPGIGRKRAEAIVARREKRRFTRVTQLLEIKGIGHKTLARLRPLVFVGKPGAVREERAHPLLQGAPEADAGPEPAGGAP